MILPAFRRSVHDRKIHVLYGMIVAQARSGVFYTNYGIPDTLEGRFELIVLHLVLVLRRLGRDSANIQAFGGRRRSATLGQLLFDAFCRDLDANLREMGVGDMAVPRRMRRFGEAFYGRQGAYQAALEADDPKALENALARNIFERDGVDPGVIRLAKYTRAAAAQLEGVDIDTLVSSETVFPDPAMFVNAESDHA
jgi:cytochrome b pre-mRNA-processing protein 3